MCDELVGEDPFLKMKYSNGLIIKFKSRWKHLVVSQDEAKCVNDGATASVFQFLCTKILP